MRKGKKLQSMNQIQSISIPKDNSNDGTHFTEEVDISLQANVLDEHAVVLEADDNVARCTLLEQQSDVVGHVPEIEHIR